MSSAVKRVISHPEDVGREYSKLSKVSNYPTSVESDAAMVVERDSNEGDGGNTFTSTTTQMDGVEHGAKIAADPSLEATMATTIPSTSPTPPELNNSTMITTMSMGNERDASKSEDEEPIDALIDGVNKSLSQSKISDDGPLVAMKEQSSVTVTVPSTVSGSEEMHSSNEITAMSRQISIDDSQKAQVILEGGSPSSSSVSQNKSESTLSSGGTGIGQWGWFEDVHHDHDNTMLCSEKRSTKREGNDVSNSKDTGDGTSCVQDGEDDKEKGVDGAAEKKKKKKKKKGLLQFGDAIGKPLLDDFVEPKKEDSEAQSMAVTAPTYVLEESMSSQKLWKSTAGTRPPQPVEERAFFEKIWANNFSRSQVSYHIPNEVLTATSPICLSPFADGNFDSSSIQHQQDNYHLGGINHDDKAAAEATLLNRSKGGSHNGRRKSTNQSLGPHDHHHTLVNKKVKDKDTDDELIVVVRGDNVFGTTVSKSFSKKDDSNVTVIDTVSISIASYRVVESKKHGKYAQFLVIFCEGTFRDTVGVWKRYSDFDKLSKKVTRHHESCTSVLAGMHPLAVTEDPKDGELLPNAITSWRLLKKRQRWYRCLDAGYLSLKVFLLERFLHDILFESSNPNILREFVNGGVE